MAVPESRRLVKGAERQKLAGDASDGGRQQEQNARLSACCYASCVPFLGPTTKQARRRARERERESRARAESEQRASRGVADPLLSERRAH